MSTTSHYYAMLVDKIHNISCGDKYDKFYFLSLFDSTRVHLWLETVPTNLMLTKFDGLLVIMITDRSNKMTQGLINFLFQLSQAKSLSNYGMSFKNW